MKQFEDMEPKTVAAAIPSPIHESIFDDPLKEWGNRDLLISEESQEKLKRRHPDLSRVLDWPALRNAFIYHDEAALSGKKATRRRGVIAVLLAGLGVALLSLESSFPSDSANRWWLLIVSLGLMTGGTALSIHHWLFLRSRAKWIGHRFWPERLRQFYFQSILQEFDLTTRALHDDEALAELKQKRTEWLDRFYDRPHDVKHRLDAVLADMGYVRPWALPEWNVQCKYPVSSTSTSKLLGALWEQRFEVQLDYARRQLGKDIHSPWWRDKALATLAVGSVFATFLAGVTATISIAVESEIFSIASEQWVGIVGAASALGLTARTVRDGLRTTADLDRYKSYEAALTDLADTYWRGTDQDKFATLIKLEELAYREFRAFIATHWGARFMP